MSSYKQQIEDEARRALSELMEEGLPVSDWHIVTHDYQSSGAGSPPQCYIRFGTRGPEEYLPIEFPDQTALNRRGNVDEIKRRISSHLRNLGGADR